jgi:hypothetical protein
MSEDGRLVRVRKYRGDPKGISYIVAAPDKAQALEIITSQAASLIDDIEDLGRVSEALITAMHLQPGQFMPIDGIRHVAQQQQPQPKTDEKE